MFPLQKHQVPERPWWQYGDEHFNPKARDPITGLHCQVVASRNDKLTLSFMSHMLIVRGRADLGISERPMPEGAPWKTVRELMGELDNLHPLPHPGTRVGQIWVYWRQFHPGLTMEVGLLTSLLDVQNFLFLRDVTKVMCRGPFLVSDQACPWLAPWSPVEKG